MDAAEFVELLWENNQSLIQHGQAKRDSRSSSPTAALPNPSLFDDNPTDSNIYTIDLESQRMSTPELSQPISQSSVPTSSKTRQGLCEALLQSRQHKQYVTWVEPSPLSSSKMGLVNFSHFSRPLIVARATIQSISGLRCGESTSATALVSSGAGSNLVNLAITNEGDPEIKENKKINSVIKNAGDSELKGKKKISEQELSISAKRTRAADVHNLSERRRRDRINEKITTLQELIPNCNKANKASILDDAIEYVKTVQLQLQMLYKQCRLTNPLMIPPTGMQLPKMPTMSPFSPMDPGMGKSIGLSYGMGMYDPSNVQNFPVPPMQEQFAPGIMGMQASTWFPMYGMLGQGLPVPMPLRPPAELPTKASSVTEISMPNTKLATSDLTLYSIPKNQQHRSANPESAEKGCTK